MSKPERKRLFVDKYAQGTVLLRIFVYWFSCLLFASVPLVIVRTVAEPDRLLVAHVAPVWSQYWPILITTTLLLPFLLYDALKVTNRFAGPIFRLRRELRRFEEGAEIGPIRFRDRDFWQDLAEQTNRLVERVEEAERRARQATTADKEHEEAESPLPT